MICLGRSFKSFKRKKQAEAINEYAMDHEADKIIVNRELPDIPSVNIILENQLNDDMQLPNNPIPSNLQLYASLSECYSIIKCKKNSVDNQETKTNNLVNNVESSETKKLSFYKLLAFIINPFTKRKKLKSRIPCDQDYTQQCDKNSIHKVFLSQSNEISFPKLSQSFHDEVGINSAKATIEPIYSQNVSNKYEVISGTSATNITPQATNYDKVGPSTSNNIYNKPIYEQGSQIYASLKDDDANYSIGQPVIENSNTQQSLKKEVKQYRHNRISSTGALPAPPLKAKHKSHRRGGSAMSDHVTLVTASQEPPSPPRFYMTVPPPPPPLPAPTQAPPGPALGFPPPGRRPPLAHSTSVDSGLGGDVVEMGGDILTLRQHLEKIKEESYTDVFVRLPLCRLMAPPFLPSPTALLQDFDPEGDGQSHQYDYLLVASPHTTIPIHTYDKVNYQRLSNSTAARIYDMDMPTTSHNYFPPNVTNFDHTLEEQVYSVPKNSNQGPLVRSNPGLSRHSVPFANNMIYDTGGSTFYDVPYKRHPSVGTNQLKYDGKVRTKSETSFKRILNKRPYSMNEVPDFYCYIHGSSSIYSNFYTNRNLMLDNSLYNFYLGPKRPGTIATQSPIYHYSPAHPKLHRSYENIPSLYQGPHGRTMRNHVYQEIYRGRRPN